MQMAGLNTLLESLLILMAIYYAVKFLARLFLPTLAKKAMEKAAEHFQKQQQDQNAASSNKDNLKSDKPHETKKVGDYVDFEEID